MWKKENRSLKWKMPLRDKYCQTDHHHHGCCEPVHTLEPGDPPLLQQPLQTSKSGIQQIIECFRSGTKQLKHILLKDVDTIFECKLCRSLFRGLPNLITHKKFYCSPSLWMDDHSPDVNDKQGQAISDLLEAMYPRVDKQDYIIRLEPIETNQNAVFQYVSKADSSVENTEMNVTLAQTSVEMSAPATEPPNAIPAPSDTETLDISPLPPLPPSANKAILTPENSVPPSKLVLKCKNNSDSGHQLICSLCKKEFHSRRSIRRHIRKVHKKKMEELKKFIEIKKRPNLTFGRGRNKNILVTLGKSCTVCFKSFATKANVRRHFDEVHRGLRRDSITPDIATRPGQPLSLEKSSAKKSLKIRKQKSSSKTEYNLTTCKCLLCKRKYSSQVMLKKHMLIVHKITLSTKNTKREKKINNARNTEAKVKMDSTESAESVPLIISPQNDVKVANHLTERKNEEGTEKTSTPSVERKSILSAEKKNVPSSEKKSTIAVVKKPSTLAEGKSAPSTERKKTSAVERKNESCSERKSSPSIEKKKVLPAKKKRAASAKRKGVPSSERSAPSVEKKNVLSAKRKSVSSTERKCAPPVKRKIAPSEKKGSPSAKRKSVPAARRKSATSAERKNASSAERKNESSAERKSAPSAERKSASSAEKKNVSSAGRKNASSAKKISAPSAEKKNASSAGRKNLLSAGRKNVLSAGRRNASSAGRKNAPSGGRKNAPSAEKNRTVSAERKNASSAVRKSIASAKKKNTPSVEKKNVSSAKKNCAASAERKHAASAKKKSTTSSKKKSVASAEKKSVASAEKKSVVSQKKCAASAEKKCAASARKKSTASAEKKTAVCAEKKRATPTKRNKVKQNSENVKRSGQNLVGCPKQPRKPRLTPGFDFKKLYCKLCKRQFSSKQNLAKHIELHTDGHNIYVKFYRCPLCTYETRRKRDVIRHITVVHKKTPNYLGKITSSLEVRAIKKSVDYVLNKIVKRGPHRDESKQNGPKQDITPNSPSKKYEGADVGIEVKVTKNFSLHTCDICGKAFAKKTFLECHKKTHKTNPSHSTEENNKTKGRSTRSKVLI